MSRIAPHIALLLVAEYAALGLLVERPLNLGLLAAGAAAFAVAASPPRRWLLLAVLLALGTWSVVLTQGLFYAGSPRTVWLTLAEGGFWPGGGLYIYREGLLHGLVQSLRFDVMALLGAGLLHRYATDELTGGLRRLRVPAGLCFLFSVALRHVPLLWQDARTVWRARRLRGLSVWGGAAALRPLLAANLRRSDEVAAALLSRRYRPEAAMAHGAPPATAAERALVVAGLGALLALAAAMTLTRLHQVGALSLPSLEPLYVWVLHHV